MSPWSPLESEADDSNYLQPFPAGEGDVPWRSPHHRSAPSPLLWLAWGPPEEKGRWAIMKGQTITFPYNYHLQ